MKNNLPAKLFIIDLYGVICVGSYRDICRDIVKKYHLPFKKVYDVVYHKYFNASALGKISEADSFRLAVENLGISEDWRKLRKTHYKYITVTNHANLKYALDLKKRGYEVLLLSKNTPPQFEHTVKKLKLRRKFRNVINTHSLGLPKASPKTIRLMLKKFKAKPGETIMIDDQDFNLVEAKKQGVHMILYRNPKQLKKETERLF
ncbi:MAG: hypothetical protein COT91_01050 [Candidatus Doudnabacteria bacterium CG10_big_fil_rev_8_21_14_0_10_41_10]|uniref:HAD family phosphatase n=1 Tax=Candidatus Doudnabacteria bacterium CG10_big_fil_rev_8_21_14_0_10_41_10 TaxID=1974551 RepID=A0A2H0VEI6_9BACT|nr:MAG: hypothetical protein COT91_01050 [Candidatus Doudnabacteria bacterium CG10_big_fil_rev_8_21_14_0_10_41_10]